MRVEGVIPQLRTTNLEESLEFYTAKLGLEIAFQYGGFYAGLRAGGQVFHLKLADESDPSIPFVEHGDHFHLYFQTDDVEAMATMLRANGVPLVADVHKTDWGTRELVIRDNEGTLYTSDSLSHSDTTAITAM